MGFMIIKKLMYEQYIIQQLALMIRKLPQELINQIAAGQVIQRPVNVIKQLVENSIDAGASQIHISIMQGGLKMIRIVDNGSGIMVADFPLLCARFATSKIKDFSDMQALSSFGFRGEALASLSYCSNLTIASRWKSEKIGFLACYRHQKMEAAPQELPMNIGTRITAEDLFYNAETRRQSLSPIEQKRRIIKLLCHLCIHYPNVRISLESQKGSENIPSATNIPQHNDGNLAEAKMQIFQKITKLSYDKFTYLPLAQLNHSCELQAIISKINSCKGKNMMLNINNRIVQSPDIFRAVERAYSECYQSIHQQIESFTVYINIAIDPKQIDCNVHPTKKAVGFFAANEIYTNVYNKILGKIKQDSAIKVIRPSAAERNVTISEVLGRASKTTHMQLSEIPSQQPSRSIASTSKQTVYAYQKNRTDSKQMPLNFFYSQKSLQKRQEEEVTKFCQSFQFKFKECQRDGNIKNFFCQISYVGCFGLRYILVHIENRLHMLDMVQFLPSFIVPYSLNNLFPIKKITHAFEIKNIVMEFLEETMLLPNGEQLILWVNNEQVAKSLTNQYGLIISDGKIFGYPCICELITQQINIDNTMRRQIAYFLCRLFYAIKVSGLTDEKREKIMMDFMVSQFIEQRDSLSPFNDQINSFIGNRVVPTLKTLPAKFSKNPISFQEHMKQMLDLKDLYKIFERC